MDALHRRFSGVLHYLATALPNGPVYDWIVSRIREEGLPEIQISAEQGHLLSLLVRLMGARNVLEIGTLAGYSTVWLARALPPGGRVITLEANARHAEVARATFERAGVSDRVELRLGPALEALARLDGRVRFDLVFIDADKANNRAYFDWARRHVRGGGLIVVDNVLAGGRVGAAESSAYGQAVQGFNEYVFGECAECSAVIPFYRADRSALDGMLLFLVPEGTERIDP